MQHAVFCTNRILDTRPFLIFLNNLQSNSVALTEALRTGSGISGAITYFLFATTRQHQVFSTCTMSATHDILPDSLVQLGTERYGPQYPRNKAPSSNDDENDGAACNATNTSLLAEATALRRVKHTVAIGIPVAEEDSWRRHQRFCTSAAIALRSYARCLGYASEGDEKEHPLWAGVGEG
mmetsp:Transcript_19342/g.42956  ORF Transcript_19342/g.42956 Transcript_19342/m.42956 type:complete len:180 (-) Transcript_19342:167-706(-)